MTVPKELANPTSIVNNSDMLFSELIGWGARAAISECLPPSQRQALIL